MLHLVFGDVTIPTSWVGWIATPLVLTLIAFALMIGVILGAIRGHWIIRAAIVIFLIIMILVQASILTGPGPAWNREIVPYVGGSSTSSPQTTPTPGSGFPSQ